MPTPGGKDPDKVPTADDSLRGESQDSGTVLRGLQGLERDGQMIGPYKLLEVLGEGGFGVVWLAERREPMVQRVALKVIKPGMDSKAVIARFELERQVLAMMDHPNLAKVFDGGLTERGRPYFVMEYVQGEPITEYADRHRLSTRQRLELFVPVCEALQHAHMRGIIHRDIKPSNILVSVRDGRAVPKVIDFGVAKAINQTLTERTIFTETGQLIGTPEYMSPEQAEMGPLDIDTRTDVYSLGVVLYELLTGLLPFDTRELRSKGFAEIQRIIREVDPPTPSRRLSTIADADAREIARRHSEQAETIARELRRELEWVPLKAIRKDRSERYASAESLAADVRRFLDGKPLEAGPESLKYQLGKLIKRHRGKAAAGGLIAAALVLGLVGTLWQAHRAREQAEVAEGVRRRAETIKDFVVHALRSGNPIDGGSLKTTVAEAMHDAARRLEASQAGGGVDAATAAEMRVLLGEILIDNGDARGAEPLLEEVLRTRRALHPGGSVEVAEALNDLGAAWKSTGRMKEAEEKLREALRMFEAHHQGDHKDVAIALSNLGSLLLLTERAAEAAPVLERAMAMIRRLSPMEPRIVLNALSDAGEAHRAVGDPGKAELVFREALALARREFPRDHPQVALALNNLGTALSDLGRREEAEPLMAECVELYRRIYSDGHPRMANCLSNLGTLRVYLGKAKEGVPALREALAMQERLHAGAEHLDVAQAANNLGFGLRSLRELDEAERMFRRALNTRRKLGGETSAAVAQSLMNLAAVSADRQAWKDAEDLLAGALEVQRKLFPNGHTDMVGVLEGLAVVRDMQGKHAEAQAARTEAAGLNRGQN